MKFLAESVEVHSRGIVESLDYQVANNTKVMAILSKSLYKDQIKAPIRELSTNAWDAHKMAGHSKPFDVSLPTHTHKEFRIRDYGTGLSDEDIKDMYRFYGASNKDHSNLFNGCMGIGSKSPFAYTNSFTSVSYYNGMKYVYINAKDESGKPTINKMREEPTDEPNGFEVSFAVRDRDIHTFNDRAVEVYEWFPVMPKIKRSTRTITKPERKAIVSGNGWFMYEGGRDHSIAVMGNIGYPIEFNHFSKNKSEDSEEWNWKYRYQEDNEYVSLLKLGLVIHFNIGDIEMDAAREGLQYTSGTIAGIKQRLDAIRGEIKKIVDARIASAKTLWEARCYYHDTILSQLSVYGRQLGTIKPEWNGTDLREEIKISEDKHEIAGANVIWFDMLGGRYHRRTCKPKHYENFSVIKPSYKVKFYLNTMVKGSYSAIERDMNDSGLNSGYLITFDDDTAKKKFLEYVGIKETNLVHTDTIPKAPKSATVTRDNTKVFTIGCSGDFTPVKVDVNKDSGVYVEINRFQLVDCTSIHRPYDIYYYLLNKLAELKIPIPTIYGIKTAHIQKFHDNKNWIKLYDWVEETVKKYLATNNLEEIAANIENLEKMNKGHDSLFTKLITKELRSNSLFKDFVDNYLKVCALKEKFENILGYMHSICKYVNITMKKHCTIDLISQLKTVYIKYPMLSVVETFSKNINHKIVIDYVNSIDNQ